MLFHTVVSEEEEQVWQKVIAMEGQTFHTSRGLSYSYHVKRNKTGKLLGEIVVDRKEKTITRATIWLAYQNALEVQRAEGCVKGPKKLGVFGASYLYPVFLRMEICTTGK